jgi:hypothetical protein
MEFAFYGVSSLTMPSLMLMCFQVSKRAQVYDAAFDAACVLVARSADAKAFARRGNRPFILALVNQNSKMLLSSDITEVLKSVISETSALCARAEAAKLAQRASPKSRTAADAASVCPPPPTSVLDPFSFDPFTIYLNKIKTKGPHGRPSPHACARPPHRRVRKKCESAPPPSLGRGPSPPTARGHRCGCVRGARRLRDVGRRHPPACGGVVCRFASLRFSHTHQLCASTLAISNFEIGVAPLRNTTALALRVASRPLGAAGDFFASLRFLSSLAFVAGGTPHLMKVPPPMCIPNLNPIVLQFKSSVNCARRGRRPSRR